MKTGANYVVLMDMNVDVDNVDSIVFTFAGKKGKIEKWYPLEVGHDGNRFSVKLYQDDTKMLEGDVLVEAQINYAGGAVSKSDVARMYFAKSINTIDVASDNPSADAPADVHFEIVGNAIIAKIEGDIKPEDIENAVNKYLEEHPIKTGITEEECEAIVDDAIDGNKRWIEEQGYTKLPAFSAEDNGKVLGIVDGLLAWVEVSSKPQPQPQPTPVPQNGTWQLKTTQPKKYVILSTDDDNNGNADFFRLLRSYGFPYTMNIESENLNKNLSSDTNQQFSESDAPSLFPSGVTVTELAKYIHDNNLGEVTQHGSSAGTLWDSDKLTGATLDGLYGNYTAEGGTKTKEQFMSAVMESAKSSDVRQGASYVEESRNAIQDAVGFDIAAVALWGGTPTAEVDGISINLNNLKTGDFNWRANNYKYAGTIIGSAYKNTIGVYGKYREWHTENIGAEIDKIVYGDVVDFYSHMPYLDLGNDKLRRMCDAIKERVEQGEVEVVTPSQYYAMGEFVENPIKSISVVRSGSLNVGDEDTDSAYSVTVTYADGTSGNPNSDMILDRSKVNTSESGNYEVNAYYRGFTASTTVVVQGAESSYPEGLKDTGYWFAYLNESSGNMYCGNSTKSITEAVKTDGVLVIMAESGSIINGWKSTDNGESWEQVTTNRNNWNGKISTSKSADTDGAYAFGSGWGNKITLIENSGFAWNY